MWLFKRKPGSDATNQALKAEEKKNVSFDASILRQNNITRLSIDERWTKLFVSMKISPELDKSEKEMGELIKTEAMLKNEQENLEPQKRKCMSEIISLTEEAFNNESDEAKKKLEECKNGIENINTRINSVLGDIEDLDGELKSANLKLLEDSIAYIFKTLKKNKDRSFEIQKELTEIEQKENALREELNSISIDWTKYAVDLTNLIGTDEVKRLELQFGLGENKDEAADATADEGN
jgi:chromosome segregation ATPase